jgi:hypothetical protein
VDSGTGVRRCLEEATFPSTLRACLECVGDTMDARLSAEKFPHAFEPN